VTREELLQAGHAVSAVAYARLARFVELLLIENRRLNLTGVQEATELWRGHVCDSLALWPRVVASGAVRVLDLGSGGGLPGLPLACVCDTAQMTLLDATRKKVGALERIIQGLGVPNARAAWGRAERLAHEPAYREQFDLVTARAVAALPVLIEYAAGFVRPGGECWFFKTQRALDEERPRAESAARACQVADLASIPYRLPGETDERVLIGYRKTGRLPDNLPRGIGRTKKRPL
jgi:16S rRNA (guanine527-N7)-methyltransferase